MLTIDEFIKFYNHTANNIRERVEEEMNKGEDSYFCEKEIAECFETALRYEQLAKWLTELKEFKENSKWHKVNEELPKESGKYLCCTESGDIFEAYFDSEIAEYDKNESPFGEYRDIFDPITLGYIDSEWCGYGSIIYWRNSIPIPKELEEELN